MALDQAIASSANINVGNPYNPNASNLPYQRDFTITFDYQITENDYFAGSVQFITIVDLVLTIPPQVVWIAGRSANPHEYGLGRYSLKTNDSVLSRGDIHSLRQRIVIPSRVITLSKNESSRPKLFSLSKRPRILMSKSTVEGMDITGEFRSTTFGLTLTGALAGTAAGAIQLTGLGVGQDPTNASVVYPRRQFIMDSTDGILDFASTVNSNWYEFEPVQAFTNFSEPKTFGLWLEPGITGTIATAVFKAGQTSTSTASPNPIWQAGSLPFV